MGCCTKTCKCVQWFGWAVRLVVIDFVPDKHFTWCSWCSWWCLHMRWMDATGTRNALDIHRDECEWESILRWPRYSNAVKLLRELCPLVFGCRTFPERLLKNSIPTTKTATEPQHQHQHLNLNPNSNQQPTLRLRRLCIKSVLFNVHRLFLLF